MGLSKGAAASEQLLLTNVHLPPLRHVRGHTFVVVVVAEVVVVEVVVVEVVVVVVVGGGAPVVQAELDCRCAQTRESLMPKQRPHSAASLETAACSVPFLVRMVTTTLPGEKVTRGLLIWACDAIELETAAPKLSRAVSSWQHAL